MPCDEVTDEFVSTVKCRILNRHPLLTYLLMHSSIPRILQLRHLIPLALLAVTQLNEAAAIPLTAFSASSQVRIDENHFPPQFDRVSFHGQDSTGSIDTSVASSGTLSSPVSYSNTTETGTVTADGEATLRYRIDDAGFWAGYFVFDYDLSVSFAGDPIGKSIGQLTSGGADLSFEYNGVAQLHTITRGFASSGPPRGNSMNASLGVSESFGGDPAKQVTTRSGKQRIVARLGDAAFLGSAKDIPLTTESTFVPVTDEKVTIEIEQNDVPPQAHGPDDIQGIRLTGHGSPVESGGYGNSELVFHRGQESSSGVTLLQAQSSVAALTAPNYVTGYLFLNNGGGNFTSFTLPDALPGGQSEFEIRYNQVAYSLSVGDVFDFTQFGSGGVESFILGDISQAEMIDSQFEIPFTFGVTNVAGSDASFVSVPLVPVPEPSGVVLLGLAAAMMFVPRKNQFR